MGSLPKTASCGNNLIQSSPPSLPQLSSGGPKAEGVNALAPSAHLYEKTYQCATCGKQDVVWHTTPGRATRIYCHDCRSERENEAKRLKRAADPKRLGRPVSFWTDERRELLKKLKGEGLSAREIAKRFGISRNAVIGILHRMGFSQRRVYSMTEEERRAHRSQRAKERYWANPEPRRAAQRRYYESNRDYYAKKKREQVRKPSIPRERSDVSLPEYAQSLNIPFLENTGCMFMPGKPDDKLCCGHPKAEGKAYCQHHAEMC